MAQGSPPTPATSAAQKLFRLRLVAPGGAEMGEGAALIAGHGLDGRLVQVLGDDAQGAEVRLATDWSRPIAELRWQVDQVVRRVRRLYDLRGARVELHAEGLRPALASALALDLRRSFGNGRADRYAGLGLDARTEKLAHSEDLFRRWVNEDPGVRTSLAIAEDVKKLAALEVDGTLEVDVLDEERLREQGLNLLLAVGAASDQSPPRLALARWLPARPSPPQSQRPLMLLGKGITFDTGGINVKPYESFVSHMRNDMAGAALAYAAFRHLVTSGYPRPLVLAIPTCENAVGERAMRPGTVVRSHRGPRVKIDHTDAEGRLILADALSFAEERYAPEHTISFATLTTAALQAYGPYATPVHFAPPALQDALQRASEASGEDLHFFAARAWHFEANRDEEADLRNTARLPGYMPHAAGSRNAAHFLLHFARAPITHVDIFASTWNWGGDHPGTGFGATGAPLRTFIEALEMLVTS